MSEEKKKKLSWVFGVSALVGFCLLTFNLAFRSLEPVLKVTLIAKDMAFYLEGMGEANPRLEWQRGKRIQLYLINRDKGMVHDLVLPELNLATEKIRFGQQTKLEFTIRQSGWFDYLCSLHPAIMLGRVEILDKGSSSSNVSTR